MMQRALIQYRNPKNYELVKEALLKAGREDLIGFDKKCLIKPRNISNQNQNHMYKGNKVSSSGSAKGAASKPIKKSTIRNVHKKKKK